MVLSKEYDKWIKAVYNDDITDVQRLEMKKAWFSGMHVLMYRMDQGTRSNNEDVCISTIKSLYDEIQETIEPWTK